MAYDEKSDHPNRTINRTWVQGLEAQHSATELGQTFTYPARNVDSTRASDYKKAMNLFSALLGSTL